MMLDNIIPSYKPMKDVNYLPLDSDSSFDNYSNESLSIYLRNLFNMDDKSNTSTVIINPEHHISITKKDDLPSLYTIHCIISIIEKNCRDPKIKEKLIEGKVIEDFEDYKFLENKDKKRKRDKKKDYKKFEEMKNNSKQNLLLKKKRGRKTLKYSLINHDEFSPDNITKKIKTTLFGLILKFLNDILNFENENKFLKLDYKKNINDSTREKELKLLKKSLKEIISFDISSKFKNKDHNNNKLIIDKIINKKIFVDDADYNTIMFALNLNYEEFIDIITYKKNIEDLINDFDTKDINYEKIKKCLSKIEFHFYEQLKKYNSIFATFFLYYLYNLERYLKLKQIRANKKKNKLIGINIK